MIDLLRTDSGNEDFRELVRLLDADLQVRDGEIHSFYAQFNKIDMIREAVIAYEDGRAIGCGAFKKFEPQVAEIKRMYVRPEARGRGVAGVILSELESWAKERDFSACVLETGFNQPEAVRLYQKSGYRVIPNYGQYAGVENSLCMRKFLD